MLGLKSELESGGVMVYSHWPEARPGQEPGKMGCMKLCGSFHITPEPGQGLRHIVLVIVTVYVLVPVLLSVNTP